MKESQSLYQEMRNVKFVWIDKVYRERQDRKRIVSHMKHMCKFFVVCFVVDTAAKTPGAVKT